MTSLRSYRPSGGFVAMLFIHVAAVALIGWGLQTPELDQVWTLEHALKAGRQSELSPRDRALLQRAFAAHPDLAGGLIEGRSIALLTAHRSGWCSRGAAVLVRLGGSDTEVDVRIDTSPEGFPVRVELEGSGWRRDVSFEKGGVVQVALPKTEHAEVVSVTARGGADGQSPTAFEISFEDNP
jgi:hypothetical protein